jgi:hypothetical protein
MTASSSPRVRSTVRETLAWICCIGFVGGMVAAQIVLGW